MMVSNFIKKGVALLGGVMMLANVVLPRGIALADGETGVGQPEDFVVHVLSPGSQYLEDSAPVMEGYVTCQHPLVSAVSCDQYTWVELPTPMEKEAGHYTWKLAYTADKKTWPIKLRASFEYENEKYVSNTIIRREGDWWGGLSYGNLHITLPDENSVIVQYDPQYQLEENDLGSMMYREPQMISKDFRLGQLYPPYREGYEFVGRGLIPNDPQAGTEELNQKTLESFGKKNVTLYAVWRETPELIAKKEKMKTLLSKVKLLIMDQELSTEGLNKVKYIDSGWVKLDGFENEEYSFFFENATCKLIGADGVSYNRHAEAAIDNGEYGSNNPIYFAGCDGLFRTLTWISSFPEQEYTYKIELPYGLGLKEYRVKFEKMSALERDQKAQLPEELADRAISRPNTPLVDIRAENAQTPGELAIAIKNNLGSSVSVKILDEKGKLLYAETLSPSLSSEQVQLSSLLRWNLRDLSSAYTIENDRISSIDSAKIAELSSANTALVPADTKVTFIASGEVFNANILDAKLEYPYTITAQDVINATIGEKVMLTLKDADTELFKLQIFKGQKIPTLQTPSKSKYRFQGWTTDKEGKNTFNLETPVENDLTLYAQWRKKSSSSSSTGGGGGVSSTPSSTSTTAIASTSGAEQQTPESLKLSEERKAEIARLLESKNLADRFSGALNQAPENSQRAKELSEMHASLQKEKNVELRNAYLYAYLRGITTQPTIEKAELSRGLTRAEMAKMMSVFAMNVLGKKVVKTDAAQYADVKMEGDLPEFIQLAYQLQIMGIDAKGNALPNFNPNVEVSRAEFATVLSRVLYGDKYNQEGADFASKHLSALKDADILKDTNPQMKELRGWVMLMLQRAEGVK